MTTLLSVNNYYYYRGGAETVFLEHNKMFEALGWQVVPFAMHHPKNLPTPWSEHFVEELELGEDYSLLEKLRRVPKSVYSFEARAKIDRLIGQIRPDICHAHNIYHHLSPSILGVLRSRGVPVILTLHDLKIACPAYNMLSTDGICERCKGGRLYNVMVHRCIKGSRGLSGIVMGEALLHRILASYSRGVSRFVVPSRFYIEKFVEWGFRREQFTHVPNFVDATRYTASYAAGGYFLFFGRISREKGVGSLIRAAATARVPLRIAGTGPQLAELQALASQLGADCTFLGYQTGEALHAVVREARAIVLPSEWYENAPMSVLEAYASGKPVIGARIGGIPELIREGETGLTYASGDIEALSAALTTVSGLSAAQIERMGRAGREWVSEDFSAASYQRRILDIYGKVARGVALEPPDM